MNIIHFMHDKYAYEAGQMALHDSHLDRLMAFGVAGLSVATDSLSAIKYAKVKPIRNEQGIAIDFEIEGDFPKYGNDDDRVDTLAVEILQHLIKALKSHRLYRNARHTLKRQVQPQTEERLEVLLLLVLIQCTREIVVGRLQVLTLLQKFLIVDAVRTAFQTHSQSFQILSERIWKIE